jgi:hypothetical protein
MEGGDLIKVYCKHICKCHILSPPVELLYANKIKRITGARESSSVEHFL